MRKILHSNIIAEKLGRLRIPLYVVWGLTYRCNLRCLYCGIWRTRRRELKTESILSIIDGLSQLGTKAICFSGGEPLLRNDLGKIIAYAHEKNIPCIDINSNGTLVKQRIASIKNIRLLCLTLDGPEEIHNRMRGRGTYKQVLEAAQIARKNKIRVYFRTVLTKLNLEYIDDVLNLANKMSIKVIFQPVRLLNYGTAYRHNLSATSNELRKAFKKLLLEKRKQNQAVNSPEEVLEYLIKWPRTKQIHCVSEKVFFHLGPDGKFFPCAWKRNLKTLEKTDALKLGVSRAIKKLPQYDCQRCNNTSSLEFLHRLYSLLENEFDSRSNLIEKFKIN
ncbi:radical SAM protein [Candidatus Omnitrophota bacterium]